MNTILILRLTNSLIAAASLPPAVLLLKHLLAERRAVAPGVRIVNKVLINSFILFLLAGMANALLSLLLLFNGFEFLNIDQTTEVFNLRDIVVNTGYLSISWGLWFVVSQREKLKGGEK